MQYLRRRLVSSVTYTRLVYLLSSPYQTASLFEVERNSTKFEFCTSTKEGNEATKSEMYNQTAAEVEIRPILEAQEAESV